MMFSRPTKSVLKICAYNIHKHKQIYKSKYLQELSNYPYNPIFSFSTNENFINFIKNLKSMPFKDVKNITKYGFFTISESYKLPEDLRKLHIYKYPQPIYDWTYTSPVEISHKHSINYDGYFSIYENKKLLYDNINAIECIDFKLAENITKQDMDNFIFSKFIQDINNENKNHQQTQNMISAAMNACKVDKERMHLP